MGTTNSGPPPPCGLRPLTAWVPGTGDRAFLPAVKLGVPGRIESQSQSTSRRHKLNAFFLLEHLGPTVRPGKNPGMANGGLTDRKWRGNRLITPESANPWDRD